MMEPEHILFKTKEAEEKISEVVTSVLEIASQTLNYDFRDDFIFAVTELQSALKMLVKVQQGLMK